MTRPRLQRNQRQLLQHLIDGRTVEEIARDRGVERDAVLGTARRIRRRLGARSTAHMVALAIGRGLVKLPAND